MKHVKICPKCRSTKIRIRWQSFWFYGFPASYQCLDCKYRGGIFPEVSTKKLKNDKRKTYGKTKLGRNSKKRKRSI